MNNWGSFVLHYGLLLREVCTKTLREILCTIHRVVCYDTLSLSGNQRHMV